MRVFVMMLAIFFTASASAADFRSSSWGDDMKTVIQVEGEPVHQEHDLLIYVRELNGVEYQAFFAFEDLKLTSGGYLSNADYSNKNDYVYDHKRLTEQLTSKYGEPDKDEHEWRSNLYRNNPDKIGMAVSIGAYAVYTSWIVDGTEIMNSLTGSDFDVRQGVTYYSIDSVRERRSKERKEALDQL
jgi:hypothetical protein